MKPKPFDALNHFTFPVGTRLSWRKIWIECSPEPLLWPGATQDSLVQFAGAALTGARVCRYTRPVARGTPAPRATTPAQGGCHETPAFWPDAACVAGIGTGGCAADPVRRVGPPEAAEGPVPRRSHRGRGEFEGSRLRAVARQHHGPGLRGSGGATARVRSRRKVRSRDRQEPVRLVVRPYRPRGPERQHLDHGQGIGHGGQVQPPGPRCDG